MKSTLKSFTNEKQFSLPKLSIITVVKNSEKTIYRCIQSVCTQTFRDYEHIIIDGKSDDATLKIIQTLKTKRTKILSEPDDGLYFAMNKGVSMATGKFIIFLNSDDHFFGEKTLETVASHLNEKYILHGLMKYIDNNGNARILGEEYNKTSELRGSRLPQPVMFVPRRLFREIGGFDTKFKIAADYEFVLRSTERCKVKFVPEIVTVMYAGGLSFNNPQAAFLESMQIARKYGRGVAASFIDYLVKVIKWKVKSLLT